jgi:Uma2 family endonuclease
MDGDNFDILSRYPVPRHRLTLEDYHRLGQAGVLGEDDRVELLEGQLVDMSPIGPRHALVVDKLMQRLVRAVTEEFWVRVQNPVALDSGSEPQPDIVLTRASWRGYPESHPGPEAIILLVEVADSSRDIDLGAKRELYARAGIREFWIVDLTTDIVLVCRNPRDGAYDSVTRIEPSGTLDIEVLPGLTIPAAALFS